MAQNVDLNEISRKIRTRETALLIEALREHLTQLQGALYVDSSRASALAAGSGFDHILLQLRRSLLLFDSNLFFVVIFGALKSGKSTLTNCLVEAEISPMGCGVDTTQRPCLMLRGEKEECCQYFIRQGGDRHAA